MTDTYGTVAQRERAKAKVFQGGMAMQKFEAQRNVNRHLEVIHNTKPTRETVRWREPAPDYAFAKQKGKIIQQEIAINHDNSFINERLVNIVAERRSNLVSEGYLPGWRVAHGGAFIDCYPNPHHNKIVKTKARMTARDRERHKQKINRENEYAHKFFEGAQSSYKRDDHHKDYMENRKMYNIFIARTNHTSLHLGLVKRAQEKSPYLRTVAEQHRKVAANAATINAHNQQRPLSAPVLGRGVPLSRTDPLKNTLNLIDEPTDYLDIKDVNRELLYGQDWDPRTNDYAYKSSCNDPVKYKGSRPGSVYQKSRSFQTPKYLEDQPNILQSQQLQGTTNTTMMSGSQSSPAVGFSIVNTTSPQRQASTESPALPPQGQGQGKKVTNIDKILIKQQRYGFPTSSSSGKRPKSAAAVLSSSASTPAVSTPGIASEEQQPTSDSEGVVGVDSGGEGHPHQRPQWMPIVSTLKSVRKLAAMKRERDHQKELLLEQEKEKEKEKELTNKNVSFVEDVNVYEYNKQGGNGNDSNSGTGGTTSGGSPAMQKLRSFFFRRQDSSNTPDKLAVDANGASPGIEQRQPLPYHHPMNKSRSMTMSELTISFDEAAIIGNGSSTQPILHQLPSELSAACPPQAFISPENLYSILGLQLTSRFALPTKCVNVGITITKEVDVMIISDKSNDGIEGEGEGGHAQQSIESAKEQGTLLTNAGVKKERELMTFLIYDIGYNLPGNEQSKHLPTFVPPKKKRYSVFDESVEKIPNPFTSIPGSSSMSSSGFGVVKMIV